MSRLARLIWRLLTRADKSADGGDSKFSRRTHDAAQKQTEGYGGYTPPGAPTKHPKPGDTTPPTDKQ
jgi:hypothetical protein